MRRLRILVVDDEVNLLKFVSSNLTVAGYEVITAKSGEEALAVCGEEHLDLVILDLMLPGIDGLEVCQQLRSYSEAPVIVLSAKSEESDKIEALNLGADDYLTKPFGVGELLARVHAVLRRSQREALETSAQLVSRGPFTLDPRSRQLTVSGREAKLTPIEFNLLHYLMQHPGKLLSHNVLLSRIWGPEYRGQTEYLRVYIGRLRQKLEPDPANPHHLLTKPGLGYMFRADPPAA